MQLQLPSSNIGCLLDAGHETATRTDPEVRASHRADSGVRYDVNRGARRFGGHGHRVRLQVRHQAVALQRVVFADSSLAQRLPQGGDERVGPLGRGAVGRQYLHAHAHSPRALRACALEGDRRHQKEKCAAHPRPDWHFAPAWVWLCEPLLCLLCAGLLVRAPRPAPLLGGLLRAAGDAI